MSPDNLFDGLFSDLPDAVSPTVPIARGVGGSRQVADNNGVSRRSHCSHTENGGDTFSDQIGPKKLDFCPAESRVEGSYITSVRSAGNVGTESKTLAEPDTSLFPLPFISVRKEEEEWEQPTPEDRSLPISPAAIRAAVEREVRALADVGRTGPAAHRNAVEITRAKVRNSRALAGQPWNRSICFVCEEKLNDDTIVIDVLTGQPGNVLQLHARCHDEHRRRLTSLVDQVMAAAGFGPAGPEITP